MADRIQRRRTKGWRMPEGAVCVDRSTPWGNRFLIDGPDLKGNWWVYDGRYDDAPERHLTRTQAAQDACDRYEVALRCDGALLEQARHALRGKVLVCWCRLDQPCHADVLLELANAPLRCEAAGG